MRRCVILLAIQPLCTASASQATAPAPAPTAPPVGDCTAPEKHQLDFWIGHWDVAVTGQAATIASSDIEALPGGCGISEHYDSPEAPGGDYQGWSYSGYNRYDSQWHQMYLDSHGNVTWYTGELTGTSMVFTAPGRAGSLQRMSYIPGDDGSVRQLGELSTDAGASWHPGYDYTYTPRH
jgi:hypothetical protein